MSALAVRAWTFKDRVERSGDGDWRASQRAEREYNRRLRLVSNEVGRIINFPSDPRQKEALLLQYAEQLAPWADYAATQMIEAVGVKSAKQWRQALNKIHRPNASPSDQLAALRAKRALLEDVTRQSLAMANSLRQELSGPLGLIINQQIKDNADLIKSIPRDAASGVADRVRRGLVNGERPEDISKSIQEESSIAAWRADTIARTETSKAQSILTQARAQSIGSESYIWHTSSDGNVRPSHADMNGKPVSWSNPPTLDGMTGHAGEFPNCRCYAEPIIPNDW